MGIYDPKAVLIRLDKIGDLISTLPVDEMPELKDFQISWIIAKGLQFIPEHAVPLRNAYEFDKSQKWKSFWQLYFLLNEIKPNLAISFQAPWWVSLCLWLARVPVRAGVQSQWHSFLFLNQALRQKRSLAEKHEADYNADLVRSLSPQNFKLGDLKKKSEATPVLKMQAPTDISVSQWNLQPRKYAVIHPGMAGSALNWSTENYIQTILKLKKQIQVVITGTAADEPWLTEIKSTFADDPQVMILQNKLSGLELLTVLAESTFVLAPSTGVLHLASSLGVRSFGIYSPIQVQHPRRWQARGPRVSIFTPDVRCPAQFKCLGPKCDKYLCMQQISPQMVLSELEKEISNIDNNNPPPKI